MLVWSFAVDDGSVEDGEASIITSLSKPKESLFSLFVFKVSLSIEVFGLYIGDAFRQRTVYHEHVTREKRIFLNSY